ncbi:MULTISPECIES: hypothetical protein [Flavobacterium]|uniref:Uncharacterized protein n=1 Tax=Flavobacterium salmonis TaxID=2654844 RepID=A0A6V6YPR6_9FLAO|nr:MULTISPECIES: hypothetical protein [Flavobacterium]OOV19613.1 hypothetical protein BXU10_08195 [Flavobacterium sp. LM4]CAD0001314.1 hypothetical protein FLAT13_00496 [Flavobacterium salmonis]
MNKYNKSWAIKAIIAVLFVFGFGITFYIFSNTSTNNFSLFNSAENKNMTEMDQKSFAQKSILDSLNTLKIAYDEALIEKTALSQELELEKKNVENLMEIIKASKNPSSSQLQVYRKQLSTLNISLQSKVSEIKNLKAQNKNLLTEIENQNSAMYQQRIKNDTLALQRKKLESTLKSASKLELNNFKVIALHEKKSGEELETDKAKSTSKLKASFSISGNPVAKTGKRAYYVQVLDQKNAVLGADKLIEFSNGKALVYSFIVAIDFQGQPVNVYGVLNSDGNGFTKGTYFINFFDKNEIIASTSITLK